MPNWQDLFQTPDNLVPWLQTLSAVTLNAKDSSYGAKGDGVSDDTTAVQAAITAASLVNGTVFFPPGNYKCLGQLTIPAAKTVSLLGSGKQASILYYAGTVDQPFVIYPGQNHGSTIRSMTITGGVHTLPAVQVLSNAGSGVNGYQSLVTFEDCWIGYIYVPGGAADATKYLAYAGVQAQCDVFRMISCDVWGRDYGLKLQQGTTDAYLTNSGFANLYQGAEANGIGLWCDHTGPYYFNGTLFATGCTWGAAKNYSAVVRSIATLLNCYCETGPAPLYAITCALNVIGGKYATDNIAAQYLIHGNGASGTINTPILNAPASGLVNLIFCEASPFVQAWNIRLNPKAQIAGGLPGTLLNIDQPAHIDFPGFTPRGHSVSQPAVPATTVAQTNTTGVDCIVFVNGGTVTVVAIGGSATGQTSGGFRVPAGQTITLTYSVAPTWQWFGD